uniref:Uncharacterized protein n=1 Tax=Mycena chlorophos TaxID=658473 RepID=A0ABQ0L5H6_MYCCL|nr:predicted protein [Mycena chlorophos]
MYIDWFNPLRNRIAGSSGKQVSCGAIVLYCLNLPPEVRYLPENVFIAGLTPSPFKPNALDLMNLLDPLMRSILQFEPPGRKLKTFYNPTGAMVGARIIPLIADLQAAREAAGFLGHSATMFCSWCLLEHEDRADLNHGSWIIRTAEKVYKQAKSWFNLGTKGARESKEKKTGVRWCSLHLLKYRDPVWDTILGYMHNWLEGVLEHQLRSLWGVGRDARRKRALAELDNADDDSSWTDTDASEAESEKEELLEDQAAFDPDEFAQWKEDYMAAYPADSEANSTPQASQHSSPAPGPGMDVDEQDDNDDDEGSTPRASRVGSAAPISSIPATQLGNTEQDVDMEADEFLDTAVHGSWQFSKERILDIRKCIQQVLLPAFVDRPPQNLGEAGHGKLKADQFYVLFSAILPLVLPEIGFDDDPTRSEHMLQSFYHLIAATKIISSFQVSEATTNEFMEHYVAYQESMQHLFPDVPVKPNHHYAFHNGRLMKLWGPLVVLAEFAGERMNDMFQSIKTNRHKSDMDFTMLRQMIRLTQLLARQRDDGMLEINPALAELDGILEPKAHPEAHMARPISDRELGKFLRKQPEIPAQRYTLILEYLDSIKENRMHWLGNYSGPGIPYTLPNPEYRGLILPPCGRKLREIYVLGKVFSCDS